MIGAIIFFSLLLLTGCADMQVPTAKEVMSHPFGNPTIRGWTKEEVIAKWGAADQVISMEPDEWGAKREEWIYEGRYPSIPVDYKYLSKTKHFYFVGDALVEMKSDQGEKKNDSPKEPPKMEKQEREK